MHPLESPALTQINRKLWAVLGRSLIVIEMSVLNASG
jgi:hypothetical protein